MSGSRLLLVLPGALHDEIRDQREGGECHTKAGDKVAPVSAREGVSCGGDLGVSCRLDQIRPDPGTVSADSELHDSVEKFGAPMHSEEAISPFLIDTQKDQKNVLFISLSVLSGNRIFRSPLS